MQNCSSCSCEMSRFSASACVVVQLAPLGMDACWDCTDRARVTQPDLKNTNIKTWRDTTGRPAHSGRPMEQNHVWRCCAHPQLFIPWGWETWNKTRSRIRAPRCCRCSWKQGEATYFLVERWCSDEQIMWDGIFLRSMTENFFVRRSHV